MLFPFTQNVILFYITVPFRNERDSCFIDLGSYLRFGNCLLNLLKVIYESNCFSSGLFLPLSKLVHQPVMRNGMALFVFFFTA
jgi:hypothetical protein